MADYSEYLCLQCDGRRRSSNPKAADGTVCPTCRMANAAAGATDPMLPRTARTHARKAKR